MSHLTINLTRTIKMTAMASAMAIALGGSSLLCTSTPAADLIFSFTGSTSGGLFTMLDPAGCRWATPATRTTAIDLGLRLAYPAYRHHHHRPGNQKRLDSDRPIRVLNGGPAVAHDITLTDASSDPLDTGGATMLLGNMRFDWSGSNDIPVTLVWDATWPDDRYK